MAGVAEIHTQASLTPNKLELMRAWLPTQAWFTGHASDLAQVGQFRFVDPAGAVGIQVMLVTSGEILYQVPLTYRDAPLVGADHALAGTMEHSVLGARWVYDAMSDPVYVSELLRTVVEGDSGAGDPESGKRLPLALVSSALADSRTDTPRLPKTPRDLSGAGCLASQRRIIYH